MNVSVELPELQAATAAHAGRDKALEAKAYELCEKYGLWLPGPAKEFLRELAAHLNWQTLKGKI